MGKGSHTEAIAELRRNDELGAPKPATLCVKNLRTSFRQGGGWIDVVKDVSFDVHAGETLAVVGESGSGKSVTGYSIMRLLDSSAKINGEVLLDGRNLLTLPEGEMRKVRGNDIAMIFQEAMTSLNPLLPIGKQIAEAIELHKPGLSSEAVKKEALRLMDRVRIPSSITRYNEYPHNFSGGMRQRAMIAMALACRPKVLIADEPTTALDVTIQAQILNLIKEIQLEEKMSVIFITHDMGVVAEIADRMAVMLRGEIVESGTTTSVFHHSRHPYTRMLLNAVPQLGSMTGEPHPAKFSLIDPLTGEKIANEPYVSAVKTSEPPVLSVQDLCVRFNIRAGILRRVISRVHAVEHVSFDLFRGETLSIVGESGSGKSTTGRGLMRLVEPDAGIVRLGEQNLMELSDADLRVARRDIQMIFQDPFASLSPRRTVGDAIAEPFLTHGLGDASAARKKVNDLLTRVGLKPEMANRLPHQFSGGQRQRICIARALALAPKVIVADESVSALDVSVKAQVINLLLDLQRDLGISLVFISHDMAVVERVSHRVAVMYMGEIVEIGPRQAIFSNPVHPYTKKLLAAVPHPDPDRRSKKQAIDVEEPKSALRSLDFKSIPSRLKEVSPGHLVRES